MASPAPRRLVLMRHAKAEGSAATDHARDLTGRGRRQSHAAGARMAEQAVVPELVLVSSATRARSTCTHVVEAMATGVETPVQVLDSLYDADADDVLAACAESVPAELTTVLVIGHNPTIADAAALLQPDTERVGVSFPTAAYAVFGLDCPWADVARGAGRLLDFYTPDA
jgi:phosphohistidine phosphatase